MSYLLLPFDHCQTARYYQAASYTPFFFSCSQYSLLTSSLSPLQFSGNWSLCLFYLFYLSLLEVQGMEASQPRINGVTYKHIHRFDCQHFRKMQLRSSLEKRKENLKKKNI